jgi:hypothetical protein
MPAQDLGYAENKMALGYSLEDFPAKPFPEPGWPLENPPLVAGYFSPTLETI